MERVWGKRKALRGAGGCRRSRRARNIIQHTHTLVGRSAQLTQALPARRGHLEESQHRHRHTDIHPYIYVNTDIPPAHQRPLGTVTKLRICFGACTISSGDTHNPWP